MNGAGTGPIYLRLSTIATLLPFATSLPITLSLTLIASSEWRRSWYATGVRPMRREAAAQGAHPHVLFDQVVQVVRQVEAPNGCHRLLLKQKRRRPHRRPVSRRPTAATDG